MFQHTKLDNQLSIIQKIKNLDYFLLFFIILLGAISIFTMYSTDGGEILFHTKSHFIKFIVFFPMMIFLSMFTIKFWHKLSYFIYLIVLGLLIWVTIFGVEASGSKRWIDFYFINLQPSELMKVAIILCLAKYYHRLKINDVNNFTSIITSIAIIIIPIMLVIRQPDLGTSILIALSGIIVLWLSGLKLSK